ncbi:MAG: ankyrin repeat domain-containing protein [Legionella sp.]|nr:ankyrin repeat domain-containing protein [Legionella sp.]
MDFKQFFEKHSIVFDEERINKEKALFDTVIREANFPDNSCDRDVYLALLPFTLHRAQSEQMWIVAAKQDKTARLHAAKLALLFGSTDEALAYLDRFAKQHPRSVQAVHDACLFSLPESKEWSRDLWRGLVLHYRPSSPDSSIMRLLPFVNKIEKYVDDNKAQLLTTIAHQIIGNEYDELMQKQRVSPRLPIKIINRKVDKEFDSLIRAELNFSAQGKLDDEQRMQYHLKKQQLIAQGEKTKIETKIFEKFEKRAKTLPTELITQSKDDYIKDKLNAIKGAIKTKLRIREQNLLSIRTPLETLENYASQIVYKRSQENIVAAALFFKHKIREIQFNRYLDLIPLDNSHQIPNLLIEGEEISSHYKNYYLKKLPPNDPRAAILGKLTSCCQSMGDVGGDAAVHGITDARGGFYVLCEKLGDIPSDEDTIVAQSWVWKDEISNHLVFDSVESQLDFRNKNSLMLADFYTFAAHRLINEYDIASVRVGAGGNTPPNLGIVNALPISKIADYPYDLDSDFQRIIADINLQFFLILFYKMQNPSSQLNFLFEDQLKSAPNITTINAWCDIVIMDNDDKRLIEGIYDYLEENNVVAVKERVKHTSNWIKQLDNILENHEDFSESAFLKIVNDAINAGVNVNTYNRPAGNAPALQLALALGYLSVVQLLLEQGADVTANINNVNLIDVAIKQDKWDIVKYLLAHLKVRSAGLTPEHTKVLFAAASSKKLSLLSYLFNEGLSINTLPPIELRHTYQPLLHMAIATKQTDLRDFLITNGADLNLRNEDGQTPLICALQKEDFDTFKCLIQHGADINITTMGQSLLWLAAQAQQWDVVSLLLDHNPNDVDAKNSNGETILILAVKNNQFDIVQKLIKNGADINAKDQTERSALHHLLHECFTGYQTTDEQINILDYLIKQGADLNIKGSQGQTPLHLITINRINSAANTEIALHLLKNGADIEAVNDQGQTVLSRIVEQGPLELVKALVDEKYANIDLVLEHAVFHKRFEVINAFKSEITGSSGITSGSSFFQRDEKKDNDANDKLEPDTIRKPIG